MINGVRQFKLINRTGAEYDMTRPERLFHNPDGLGWGTEREIRRIGMTYFADDEKEIHQRPTGEMVFRTYTEYAAFLSFCQVGGLVLAYKPRETWYYAKCLISINKSEIKVDTLHLVCPVNFTLTSYWYERVIAETATPEDPTEPTYISLSGETVTFVGAYEYPLANLEVDIQGSQDFNGYSKRWVGGAGKNKIDFSRDIKTIAAGLTVTVNGDGSFSFRGTATGTWSYVTETIDYSLPAGTYTLSVDKSLPFRFYIQWIDTDNVQTNEIIMNPATSVTFTRSTLRKYRIVISGISNGANIDVTFFPQLEQGSTATSWEPYENIAPITAYDTVTITQTGNSETKTYDVELTGAGSVYKGTLNVTTGVLVVDKVVIYADPDYSGTYSSSKYGNNRRFVVPRRNIKYSGATSWGLANTIPTSYIGVIGQAENATENLYFPHSSGLMVTMVGYGDDGSPRFKEWLREHPTYLAYELATPQTYQLTPTEIKNLIGNQDISANSGDIIDATVRTDGPNVYKIYPYRYSYMYGAGISNVFDFDLDLPSYFKLTIFGEINNPSWRLLVNGEIVKTGAMQNLTVSSTQKFVLNTNPKEMEIALYSNRDVRVGSVYGKSNFTTERIFELPKGRSQLQIMTDDENIPKVMIEVLKHV